MRSKLIGKLCDVLSIIFFLLVGFVGTVFCLLYISALGLELPYINTGIVGAISAGLIALLTVFTIIFFTGNHQIVYKIFLILTLAISFLSACLYFLKISGFFTKIKTIDDFRTYISSFGAWTGFVFVIFQFLQVVLLPIPSFITIGAGVLMYGPFVGALLSCIGIIIGSLFAFFAGRIFGIKVVRWLIGEKNLKKGLEIIKGKDRIVLGFMLLFPFFPDDVLCFVAGLTTIKSKHFVVMIVAIRLLCVFASSYSLNNSIIPYNTWWGILLWILLFILTIIAFILIYKFGEKIEKYLKTKILSIFKQK